MAPSLKQQFPLRIILGREDVTPYIDQGWSFSSVDPGGFEMCSLPIPKDMPQTLRGTYCRIDSGLGVAWEGRVSEVQRSLGNQTTITGEGYGALLKDNAASMIFVDRDLTRWQGPSVQRQINLAATYNLQGAEVAADPTSGNPSIAAIINGAWGAAPSLPAIEAWYDAGPLNVIEGIYYVYDNPSSGFAFNASVLVSSNANATSTDTSANFTGSPSGSGLFVPADQWRFALLAFNYASAGGNQGQAYPFYWQQIAVFGNHGLAGQGPNPQGFYPSQIAGWIDAQIPGLGSGVIPATDATGYIIPHAVYYDETGLDQMIQDMATAAGWHWGVWPALSPLTGSALPRLDFRPYPAQGQYSATCWRSDCDTCDVREDLSGMYDTAVITYSDVLGNDQAVSVFAANPILQAAGNIHRTVILNGGTMTAAAAAVFGAMALNLLFQQNRVAGSLVIKNAVNSLGGPIAPWMIRPGLDRMRINDLPSVDAFGAYNDVPFNRMECTGSSDGYSTTLEVGSGQNLVETLQSRLNASAVLAAQGG